MSSFGGRLNAFRRQLANEYNFESVVDLLNIGTDEANEIYLSLMQSGNSHLAEKIGNTSDSDFVNGNAAVVTTQDVLSSKHHRLAESWGIEIDPDTPEIWRDKKAAVTRRIGGDVTKHDMTSLMELVASMFFEKEEQRTQLATSGPTYQYQKQLDTAVPASSPQFVNWFRETMDVWTNLPAGYRSQFLADLQRTNEQAWADLIHECIYEPGKRPSETTEIIPEPEDSEEDGRGEHERPGREWPDNPPPGTGGHRRPGQQWPDDSPPGTGGHKRPGQEWPEGEPPSVGGHRPIRERLRPIPEDEDTWPIWYAPQARPHTPHGPFWPRVPSDWPYGPGRDARRKEYEESGAGQNDLTLNIGPDDWGHPPGMDTGGEVLVQTPAAQEGSPSESSGSGGRNSSFGQNFEHPLDPEAWDRHGLGFLRAVTPGFIEDWLMDNYSSGGSR